MTHDQVVTFTMSNAAPAASLSTVSSVPVRSDTVPGTQSQTVALSPTTLVCDSEVQLESLIMIIYQSLIPVTVAHHKSDF